MAAAVAPGVRSMSQMSGRTKVIIMAGTLLGLFTSAMDQTVVGTSMPRIIADLGGFGLFSWVGTGFMLASTTTVPIVGKLTDIYGRKPFYMLGIFVLLLGSAEILIHPPARVQADPHLPRPLELHAVVTDGTDARMRVPSYHQSSGQIGPAVLLEVDQDGKPAQVHLVTEENIFLKWRVVPNHRRDRVFQAGAKFLHEPLLRHAQRQGQSRAVSQKVADDRKIAASDLIKEHHRAGSELLRFHHQGCDLKRRADLFSHAQELIRISSFDQLQKTSEVLCQRFPPFNGLRTGFFTPSQIPSLTFTASREH